MKRHLTGGVMAAAVALALSSFGAQAAPHVMFDFDNGGGPRAAEPIDRFDWNNIAVLAQNAFSSAALSVTGARLFAQGQLNAASFNSVSTTETGANLQKFTFQFSIPVTSTRSTDSDGDASTMANGDQVVWSQGATPDYGLTNYFRIYTTDPAATAVNVAAGKGYGSSEGEITYPGKLILEGKITINNSGARYTIDDVTEVDLGTAGNASSNHLVDTIQGSGSINIDIDVCSTNQAASDAADPTLGQICDGGASFVDTAYFKSNISSLSIRDMDFGGGIQTEFSNQAVPNLVVNQTIDFGGGTTKSMGVMATDFKNNFTCEVMAPGGANPCDMLYQGQNAPVFVHTEAIPEPGSVALVGLGLGLLGFAGLRRKRLV